MFKFLIFFCFYVFSFSVFSRDLIFVLDSSYVIKEAGDVYLYSGDIKIDMNGDLRDDIVRFNYSKIGPSGTCHEPCVPYSDRSVITASIRLQEGGLPIGVSYMCNSLGFYNTFTNGMRDILCDEKFELFWNGSGYILGD